MLAPLLRDRARDPRPPSPRWGARIAWFVALWLASVLVVGAVAWIIRLWIVG